MEKHSFNLRYDEEADALYVRLSEKPYAYGVELDTERRIDYAHDGTPIGIEVLCASQGVDMANLPMADQLAPKVQMLVRPRVQPDSEC